MRVHLSNKTKERLGDLAVLTVLVVAFLITGCGIPDQKQPEQAKSQPVGELVPAAYTPAPPSVEATTPEPVVATVVTFDDAEAAYHEGRYDEAVVLFTAYNERRVENPWGLYMLGLSAWKAGKYALAETAFNEALSKDPRHVKSLINLSRVLLETERPEEALGEIEFALEIDSTSVDARRLEGRALYELGRVDDAIEAYRAALLLEDHDVWSMNNLGLIYLRQGQFVDALPPLARAAELEPKVAVIQNNLGMALERSGYLGSAVEAYRAAVAADSTHGKARANRDRLEAFGMDLDITADLPSFARMFADEIERWRGLTQF